MRISGLLFISQILLLSCGQNSDQKQLYQHEDNVYEVVDTVMEFTSKTHSSAAIPTGYTRIPISGYVPQNDIERHLMEDLKLQEDATNNFDYKKIVSFTYPDYFKYIQTQYPNKTIQEIKKIYEEILAQYLTEKFKRYISVWPEAKRIGYVVTDIKNRVKEGTGLLYLYEYHTVFYSESDTIFKKEAEYAVCASLNNGGKWYSTADGIEDIFRVLGISFSKEAIDEVLTKK